jgi:hypothetical protein
LNLFPGVNNFYQNDVSMFAELKQFCSLCIFESASDAGRSRVRMSFTGEKGGISVKDGQGMYISIQTPPEYAELNMRLGAIVVAGIPACIAGLLPWSDRIWAVIERACGIDEVITRRNEMKARFASEYCSDGWLVARSARMRGMTTIPQVVHHREPSRLIIPRAAAPNNSNLSRHQPVVHCGPSSSSSSSSSSSKAVSSAAPINQMRFIHAPPRPGYAPPMPPGLKNLKLTRAASSSSDATNSVVAPPHPIPSSSSSSSSSASVTDVNDRVFSSSISAEDLLQSLSLSDLIILAEFIFSLWQNFFRSMYQVKQLLTIKNEKIEQVSKSSQNYDNDDEPPTPKYFLPLIPSDDQFLPLNTVAVVHKEFSADHDFGVSSFLFHSVKPGDRLMVYRLFDICHQEQQDMKSSPSSEKKQQSTLSRLLLSSIQPRSVADALTEKEALATGSARFVPADVVSLESSSQSYDIKSILKNKHQSNYQ